MDEGFKATEEFVAASGKVRGLIADGRVARAEVDQVRVAARRALGEAARALGRDWVAQAAQDAEEADRLSAQRVWRAHTQVAIGHLRRELKALRDRAQAVTVTTKSLPERLVEQALAEAKLEQTVHLAELLLGKEDFDLLVDTLELRKYVV